MPSLVTDVLGWLIILGFLSTFALKESRYDSNPLRYIASVSWGGFAVFWGLLIPFFWYEQQSFIEVVLAALAIPACLHAGYQIYHGRDSLYTLTSAVGLMGVMYLSVQTIEPVERFVIETVTRHTELAINAVGYNPEIVRDTTYYQGYRNIFLFEYTDGATIHRIRFRIRLACTGLGSIAIFTGLVGALDESVTKRLSLLGVVIPIIYVLNIARTTFIALAFGNQWFHYFPDVMLTAFSQSDPYVVSYLIADKIISQLLAVVVLLGFAFLTLRTMPSVGTVFEDVLFLLTGTEYQLRADD